MNGIQPVNVQTFSEFNENRLRYFKHGLETAMRIDHWHRRGVFDIFEADFMRDVQELRFWFLIHALAQQINESQKEEFIRCLVNEFSPRENVSLTPFLACLEDVCGADVRRRVDEYIDAYQFAMGR